MNTDIVVLDALPGRIFARRTLVALADAVAPIVAADEIAARPAIDRRVQLFEQRHNICSPPFDVIGWHQGNGKNSKLATAAADDFQPGVFARSRWLKVEWVGLKSYIELFDCYTQHFAVF